MLGALLQGVLGFLPYRNILLIAPVASYVALKVAKQGLQITGLLRNTKMDGLPADRTAILYANEHGEYEKAGDSEVCVIMLAAVSHHPLGIFAPGFKDVGDRFNAMTTELEKNPTKYGYLGSSFWLGSEHTGGNEQMTMMYFKTLHDCHEFAHGKMHTDTMLWWQQHSHKLKHVGIMHEVFAVPKHASEGVYVNYHPTGMGATFTEANVNGEKMWMSPLVQGKGRLTYSKGRMGRPLNEKNEWTAFEETLGEVDGR